MNFAIVGIFYLQGSQAQTSTTTISGKFYKFDVLATNTSLGVTSINAGASINDNGRVAFTAPMKLFTADGNNPVRTIFSFTSQTTFDEATQINNNNLLLARTYQLAGSGSNLYRFDTNQQPSPATTIATNVGTADFSILHNSSFGLNKDGQPVFSANALTGGNNLLVTGIRTTFNQQVLGTNQSPFTIRPMVADNGNVVVRAGNTNTSPIRLYNYDLISPTDIATVSPTTFSELGQSPGISDDGEVIVFYGVLNANPGPGQNSNYNQTYQTTAGSGIFASIVDGTNRRIVRIAGRWVEDVNQVGAANDGSGNLDGVCDPAELNHTPSRCIQGELGFITTGTTNAPITFASFGGDNRIGVVHKSEPPNGIDNDTFIVSFLATPSSASSAPQYFSNQLGLWAIRVDMQNEAGIIREKVFQANPVIQVGDNLGSATKQVTGISIYDPIALAATEDNGSSRIQRRPDHRLAFRVSTIDGTVNGSAIVRATYTDSDEDGLADHWERSGIDFNQDGTIDLALNNPLLGDPTGVGANPNRKDMFVEIDYMENADRTHRPDYAPRNMPLTGITPPMTAVRNAFSAAPIRNIDGSYGVTLHTFVDEALPEVVPLLFPNRGSNNNDDFDDFKFGSNGTPAGTPCGLGVNDGHFGFPADRGTGGTPNPNCANILGAKRLIFRYAIFAQTVATAYQTVANPNVTGRAELPGNDFVVSFTTYGNATRPNTPPNMQRPFNIEEVIENVTTFWQRRRTNTTFDIEFGTLQAFTFMHELGHTLNLRHGGGDNLNCKPNYVSVMSYSRQSVYSGNAYNIPTIANLTPVRTNARLDYSRNPALPVLNENSLVESAGIGGADNERTIYGVTIPSPTPFPVPNATPYTNARVSPANVEIDWNGNGNIDLSPVSVDINNIINVCNGASPSQTFNSFDDWSNLRYNFFSTYNFVDGSVRATDVGGPEIDGINLLNGGLGSRDVDGDGVENISDNCIFSPNQNQSDINNNGKGDACDSATTQLADLSLSVSSSVSSIQINNTFNYVLTVSNGGPNTAQSVLVTDPLPSNVSLVSATPSQGSCSGTTTVVCNLGSISNNGTAIVTISVTPTTRGKLDNFANVSMDGSNFIDGTSDPNIIDNTGSVSITVLDSTQTYTISGRVTDINNNGISEVIVTLFGSQNASVLTDNNGNYSFTNLPAGGYFTVTPTKYGYFYDPTSRLITELNSNKTINFTSSLTDALSKRADFDGDGKTDVSVFRPSEGNWYVLRSLTNTLQVAQWGIADDKLVPGDYNGDKKTDFAVWRSSNDLWYVLKQDDGSYTITQWGLDTDIPVAGDYDGDGKTDIAVWRPSTGIWYILRSSDGYLGYYQLGSDGDVPMSGDFDGDGRFDFAVFRPSNITWYINQTTLGAKEVQFGLATDKLAPADYDGDGSTDFGVFRPSTGYWYTAPSTEPNPGQNFTATLFGESGDIPAPGDFDGDGKYDRAVFRPSTGYWWILKSSDSSNYSQEFGIATDKPIPSAYIP